MLSVRQAAAVEGGAVVVGAMRVTVVVAAVRVTVADVGPMRCFLCGIMEALLSDFNYISVGNERRS